MANHNLAEGPIGVASAPAGPTPEATILGGLVAVVTDRAAIEALHDPRECWGTVRVGSNDRSDVVAHAPKLFFPSSPGQPPSGGRRRRREGILSEDHQARSPAAVSPRGGAEEKEATGASALSLPPPLPEQPPPQNDDDDDDDGGQRTQKDTTAETTPATTPRQQQDAQRRTLELRLMLEEEAYLARAGRLRVVRGDDVIDDVVADATRRSPYAPAAFAARLAAFAHFRDKGYVAKPGLQFGCDYLLYRGSPDEYHAEYCVLVTGAAVGPPLTWRRLKTLTRLAQDVRKRFLLAHVVEADDDHLEERGPSSRRWTILEMVVDDAFLRPPDALASAKRRTKKEVVTAEARKRRRGPASGSLSTGAAGGSVPPSVPPGAA